MLPKEQQEKCVAVGIDITWIITTAETQKLGVPMCLCDREVFGL